MTSLDQKWILRAYHDFAFFGKLSFDDHLISKNTEKQLLIDNQQSIQMDHFFETLLLEHYNNLILLDCKRIHSINLKPSLIALLIEHKAELLFNKQFRIRAINQRKSNSLLLSNTLIGDLLFHLCLEDLDDHLTISQINRLKEFVLENLLLHIKYEDFHEKWFEDYFKKLKMYIFSFGTLLYGLD